METERYRVPSFNQDIDLTSNHIRQLVNADGIEHFFALLGYTIDRKKCDIEKLLSMKRVSLYNTFKESYIERIVCQDNGRFEIYLVELPHVRRKDVWKKFIDNFCYQDTCNYLFVLAQKGSEEKYQFLNFLLVERDIPTYVLKEQIYKQWSLPHITTALNACCWPLEVKPRKPDESTRRLLCGFTYTEADPKQQHGKLMHIFMKASNGTLKGNSKQKIPVFNDQGLFPKSYILRHFPSDEILKDNREQRDYQRAYTTIRDQYQDIHKARIEQTIDGIFLQLFEPVLQTLGFHPQILPEEDMPVCYKLTYNYSIARRQTKSSQRKTIVGQQVAEGIQTDTTSERGHQILVAPRLPGIDDIDQAERPLTYCLVYPWGNKMDGIDGQSSPLMPDLTERVVRLLQDVNWVIVTNGKLWRLYTAKAPGSISNYYEVNLADITALPREQGRKEFQYFWFFFRATAFTTFPSDLADSVTYSDYKVQRDLQRSVFLDTFLRNSQRHAQMVEQRLKDRVFVKIFLHFAEGFIAYARQNNLPAGHLEELSLEERRPLLTSVFRGTLTFLYRLLFLFYAEARGLLPTSTEQEYYTYSLERMTLRISMLFGWSEAERDFSCRIYAEDKTFLYDELQELFRIIDKGRPALHVPQYNGGLFRTGSKLEDTADEVEAAHFLATNKIPDFYLALGLDHMARDPDKELDGEQFNKIHKATKDNKTENKSRLVSIDYSELGVCQLGSIYEGLLEFKLDLPDKEECGKDQALELFSPLEEDQRNTRKRKPSKQASKARPLCSPNDSICLRPDQHDRKASGSYYTPEYIVQYIVNETIGPSLEKHLQAMRRELMAIDRQLQRQQRTTPQVEQEIYENHQSAVEKFFDFRILDPAAGSGHFLITAIDCIAGKMMDQIEDFRSRNHWHIVTFKLKSMRERIIQEMQEKNIFIDLDKLDDLTLLKRYVLKNCIYGVDVNPMAVELTKVSLWLHCFTPGAPLVYLDHHIKSGNSLIGVKLGEVYEAMEVEKRTFLSNSTTWARISSSTKSMIELNKLADITPQQVQDSKEAYELSAKAIAPFQEVLNVYTSRWFSNRFIPSKKSPHLVDMVLDFLRSNEAKLWVESHATTQLSNVQRNVLYNAEKDAKKHTFFHWELEFPDVFVDSGLEGLAKNVGFDVVIGNPPYVRQEGLGGDKVFFQDLYKVYNGRSDLYTYFIERGHTLLRKNGQFGMITANKFMRTSYGAMLRSFLITQVKLKKLIDFGDLAVFDDATAYPVIILYEKTERDSTPIEYALITEPNFENLPEIVRSTIHKMPDTAFSGFNWSLALTDVQSVLDKLMDNSITLQNYPQSKIRRGILTGMNEAFIIDQEIRDKLVKQDPKSSEIIKPFLFGENIRRYTFTFNHKYLIWTYTGVPIQEYQAVYKHLQQYQERLEKRWDQGKHWWELRSCNYYSEFEKAKIIFPDIAVGPRFTYNDTHEFIDTTVFMIPTGNFYLLALLNSKLFSFFLKFSSPSIKSGFLRFKKRYVEPFPVKNIAFISSLDERAYYQEKAHLLYQLCTVNDQSGIIDFVEYQLARSPEASDIVHDLLVFLAKEMLHLNKEKQALQKEFLDYLVSALKIQSQPHKKSGKVGLDALHKGKSTLLNYPGDYQKGEKALKFTSLRAILEDNQRYIVKLIIRNSNLLQEIESVYNANIQKIEAIKAQLMLTDNLIDEIIYHLYRLTPEEALLVKASTQ